MRKESPRARLHRTQHAQCVWCVTEQRACVQFSAFAPFASFLLVPSFIFFFFFSSSPLVSLCFPFFSFYALFFSFSTFSQIARSCSTFFSLFLWEILKTHCSRSLAVFFLPRQRLQEVLFHIVRLSLGVFPFPPCLFPDDLCFFPISSCSFRRHPSRGSVLPASVRQICLLCSVLRHPPELHRIIPGLFTAFHCLLHCRIQAAFLSCGNSFHPVQDSQKLSVPRRNLPQHGEVLDFFPSSSVILSCLLEDSSGFGAESVATYRSFSFQELDSLLQSHHLLFCFQLYGLEASDEWASGGGNLT